MGKHKKLAIFVAPILMVIGYIVSDYYLEYKAEESKLFQLVSEGECDVLNNKCILNVGELKVNVFDVEGVTTVNSTFPLDEVTFFIVDEKNKAKAFVFKKVKTAYYWHSPTPLRELVSNSASPQKLRLIARVKGGQYISEFETKSGY